MFPLTIIETGYRKSDLQFTSSFGYMFASAKLNQIPTECNFLSAQSLKHPASFKCFGELQILWFN